jgi:tetratricopeptide (TPR) repeat protein
MTIDESPAANRPARGPADERWYLTDEREFLQRSLADADRERDAGDLSDEDYAVLRARDSARLVEVERELSALDEVGSTGSTGSAGSDGGGDRAGSLIADGAERVQPERAAMPLWRKLGIAAACLLIGVGGVTLVVHFVSARQPGQASSGSVTVSQAQLIEQQLTQASSLNAQGSTKEALVLYDKVLSEDPSNPNALANAGFIQWNVGSTAQVASLRRVGRAEIQTAIKDAPTYYQAHLYEGLVLENQDHNHTAAVAQFNQFLAELPSGATGELAQAAPLVSGAYVAAHVPVPAQFTTATSTTTTTTSPSGS